MEGNSEAVKNGRREQSELRRKRTRVTLVVAGSTGRDAGE